MSLADDEIFVVTKRADFSYAPPKGSFNKSVCTACGEYVFERYLRLRDGKPYCIPCAGEDDRTRGRDVDKGETAWGYSSLAAAFAAILVISVVFYHVRQGGGSLYTPVLVMWAYERGARHLHGPVPEPGDGVDRNGRLPAKQAGRLPFLPGFSSGHRSGFSSGRGIVQHGSQ
jgi:hypothetical protein